MLRKHKPVQSKRLRGVQGINHENTDQKKAVVSCYMISEEVDFRTKNSTRHKEGHYNKGMIHHKDMNGLKVYLITGSQNR